MGYYDTRQAQPRVPSMTSLNNVATNAQRHAQSRVQSTVYSSRPLDTIAEAASPTSLTRKTPAAGTPSYRPPQMRAGWNGSPSTASRTTQAMARMSINQPTQPARVQASNAGAPRPMWVAGSLLTCHFPQEGQANSSKTIAVNHRDRKEWCRNAVCVHSPWERYDFKKGDVICLPSHMPNMNPEVDPKYPELRLSEIGPVISKRRFMIVLLKFKTTMFCIPLFTFGKRGIDEYIELIRYVAGTTDLNQSEEQERLDFIHDQPDRPWSDLSTVHITAGWTVGWKEDIQKIGRLTKTSYTRLMKLWKEHNKTANDEECFW